MAYRELFPQPIAQSAFDDFLGTLERNLSEGRLDRNQVVRDTLFQIYCGVSPSGPGRSGEISESSLGPAALALMHSFDPRNAATEPEFYVDIDAQSYAERKPLIWLWQMFDRSPLGLNAHVGHRFRRMLAPMIFKRVGANFKCWQFVEWTFGYKLAIGDNVVIHRHVLLDDRGGIEIGDNVSISDYVNIYSHTHDVNDITRVYTEVSRIGNRARITYHATVLAGTQVGEDALVGTSAVTTRDVEPCHIKVGIPAKTVKIKEPGRAPAKASSSFGAE